MKGAHDCGGVGGYGRVEMEADEPVFHSLWEARMFALMSAVGDVGGWSLDEDRSACESMEPARYVASSYYEHWLHGLESLLIRHAIATEQEIRSGRATVTARQVVPTPAAAIWSAVTARGSYERLAQAPARFASGDHVRARRMDVKGHTRLPHYLQGHGGQIIAVHGAHVFPDSNASGKGEDPQWLYTVRFKSADVWNRQTRDVIHADLWEPYLEPA